MAREVSPAERRPDQVLLDRIDEALPERFWLELEGEIETMADAQIREEPLEVFRAIRRPCTARLPCRCSPTS